MGFKLDYFDIWAIFPKDYCLTDLDEKRRFCIEAFHDYLFLFVKAISNYMIDK